MGDQLNGGPVDWEGGTFWTGAGRCRVAIWVLTILSFSPPDERGPALVIWVDFSPPFFLSWWKRRRPPDDAHIWWCPYMDPGQSLLSTILPQESVWVEQPVNRATQWNGSNLMIIFINSDHLLVKSDFSFNIIEFPNVTAEQWTSPSSYLVKQKSKKSVKECSF